MILANIKPTQSTFNCVKIKYYILKIKKLIIMFNSLKYFLKKVKKLPVSIKKNQQVFKHSHNQNLINYVINIVLSQTNTLVNITDIYGNVKLSFSAGSIQLTKTQKKAQPLALIKIFKLILSKAKFLNKKTIALHFKNTNYYHESTIIKLLKTKLFIKSVQNLSLIPHNGCRPKKLRRIKRRTKRMVLK